MNKYQSYTSKLLKRVGVFLSLVVIVAVQAHSAYASACMMTMQSAKVASAATQDNNIRGNNTKLAPASNDDVPPCHQQITATKHTQSAQAGPSLPDTTKTDCCGEHCPCVKGGCSTMAFIPLQPHTNFLQPSSQNLLSSKNNLTSTLIQNFFRPPIVTSLG